MLHLLPALIAAVVLALPVQKAAALDTAASAARAVEAAPGESIAIELPDEPAQPAEDDLVGGWHGFFLVLALVAFVGLIVSALAHHHYHYDHWYGDCETVHHHHDHR